MEKYVIKGGNVLEGEVSIAGAKNAALGILAAAVMTDEECIIENVPYVEDTKTLLRAIETIGAKVKYIDNHTVSICGGTIRTGEDVCVDDEYIRKIRASYYLLGALLGKYNYAQVALPGGCDIGLRPIDQHIKGFEALGAKVEIVNGGKVVAKSRPVDWKSYLSRCGNGWCNHQYHDGSRACRGQDDDRECCEGATYCRCSELPE